MIFDRINYKRNQDLSKSDKNEIKVLFKSM